jgi:hypothetical protein
MKELCSCCERHIDGQFLVTVFLGDGSEVEYEDQHPGLEMFKNSVVIYKHKKCEDRSRIYGKKEPKWSEEDYDVRRCNGDIVTDGLRVRVDGGKFMMVLPVFWPVEKK